MFAFAPQHDFFSLNAGAFNVGHRREHCRFIAESQVEAALSLVFKKLSTPSFNSAPRLSYAMIAVIGLPWSISSRLRPGISSFLESSPS